MNFPALLIALVVLPAACSARALRGLEVVAAPNGTQAEPRDLFDDPLEYLETAVEVAADAVAGLWGGGVCLYGNNCGMNCEHATYDEDDPLDKACYEHDFCLQVAETVEERCECDDTLIRDAAEIADWDDGSDMVRTAATVRDGMKDYGKAYHGCWS